MKNKSPGCEPGREQQMSESRPDDTKSVSESPFDTPDRHRWPKDVHIERVSPALSIVYGAPIDEYISPEPWFYESERPKRPFSFFASRPASDAKRTKRLAKDKQEMERLLRKPSQFMQNFISVLTDVEWRVAILHYGNQWKKARIARTLERDRSTIAETIDRVKRKMNQHDQNMKKKLRVQNPQD
jgi:hypothetical protein